MSFRKVSHEYCVKRKLCTTSAEKGTLRCASPAFERYRSKDEKKFKTYGWHYVCLYCLLHVPQGGWKDFIVEEV